MKALAKLERGPGLTLTDVQEPEVGHNDVLINLAENLFTHMRMIRRKTIAEKDRADRSIRDHMNIIESLEARATDRAGDLVRDHALGLAEHVAKYADYLD